MHHADLTMIDASQDPWFDLDLVHYQAQLVNGYTRMTVQAGLEIFMPGLDERPPREPARASRSNGSKAATALYRLTFQSSSARFVIGYYERTGQVASNGSLSIDGRAVDKPVHAG